MKKHVIIYGLFILFMLSKLVFAQDDIQIGSPNTTGATAGGFYDYSDPSGVNFRVQLWGYVRFPGFYLVPAGTSLNELISLAGGPREDARLTDIRIVKMKEGTQTEMIVYNYNDIVWENKIRTQIKYIRLSAGDIVIVPGEPRYFVREDISFYVSLITALASLTALVIGIISLTD